MFANHPARQQVEPSKRVGPQPPASDRAANGSQQDRHYNIWYHRHTSPSTYTGDKSRERSTTRCNIARDSGTTLADRHPEGAYFCLFFARGCCPHGPNCHYLHRIPTYSDRIDTTKDCFGRDLHRDYRQDMSGVGTFLNEKRTLYVGRISLATKNIEETVRRHFSEWGDIDKSTWDSSFMLLCQAGQSGGAHHKSLYGGLVAHAIVNVLKDRGVAFVSYMNRTNCEFAKEAMDRQSLDNDEVLNVRWAHEDPNPKARAAFKRKSEMMYHQAILADLPAEYNKGLIDKLDQEEQEEEERERKRRELVYGSGHGVTSGSSSSSSDPFTTKVATAAATNVDVGKHSKGEGNVSEESAQQGHQESGGILSSAVMSALKHHTQSRAASSSQAQMSDSQANSALLSLAKYDSSDQSESDDG